MDLSRTMCAGISRSTSAPLIMVPTVGWFLVTLAPPPPLGPAENPPTASGPWATA